MTARHRLGVLFSHLCALLSALVGFADVSMKSMAGKTVRRRLSTDGTRLHRSKGACEFGGPRCSSSYIIIVSRGVETLLEECWQMAPFIT